MIEAAENGLPVNMDSVSIHFHQNWLIKIQILLRTERVLIVTMSKIFGVIVHGIDFKTQKSKTLIKESDRYNTALMTSGHKVIHNLRKLLFVYNQT